MSDNRTKNAFISPFPAEWQTVIFRCYGFVSAKNIAGEEVTLFRHQEGDTYFVEGKVEDRQAFCVKIQF